MVGATVVGGTVVGGTVVVVVVATVETAAVVAGSGTVVAGVVVVAVGVLTLLAQAGTSSINGEIKPTSVRRLIPVTLPVGAPGTRERGASNRRAAHGVAESGRPAHPAAVTPRHQPPGDTAPAGDSAARRAVAPVGSANMATKSLEDGSKYLLVDDTMAGTSFTAFCGPAGRPAAGRK